MFRLLVGSERVQRCYLDAVRKNPTLGGQWDKPGFRELVDELSRAGG